MPLPQAHLLDELAMAFIQVLAAAAGAIIAVGGRDYGVDGTLRQILETGNERYDPGSPSIISSKAPPPRRLKTRLSNTI
jgi:hypothetical protein